MFLDGLRRVCGGFRLVSGCGMLGLFFGRFGAEDEFLPRGGHSSVLCCDRALGVRVNSNACEQKSIGSTICIGFWG